MRVRMAFGKMGLDLELPAGFSYKVLEARTHDGIADPQGAIRQALDSPIASPTLEELARGKKSAAIAVCDITRPVPNTLILPQLLDRLQCAGIPLEAISICIATGLHRRATEAEIEQIVGAYIARTVRVVNHDARVAADHRPLGNTRRGTPVAIDEQFMAADLHITVGLIEPHMMLGFSGGRKLIAPGLAYQDTIKAIHAPRFMQDPSATEGSFEHNTLHHELLEIACMAGHHFSVNVTLTRTRHMAGVFAGHPEEAHAAGVAALRTHETVHIPERMDGAITSAAGYPLDLTLYQAVKGVTAAAHVVKPGGPILVFSECAEGIGSADFASQLQKMGNSRSFLEALAQKPVQTDQWQLEKLALVMEQHPVLFCAPTVDGAALGAFRNHHFRTPDDALAAFSSHLPAQSQVAVIPEGPYVFAQSATETPTAVTAG